MECLKGRYFGILTDSPAIESHQGKSIHSLDMNKKSLGSAHSETEDRDMKGPSQ